MDNMERVLHVNNLGVLGKEEPLRDFFAEVADVDSVRLCQPTTSNSDKDQYAFVTFMWADDVALILTSKRSYVEGLARIHSSDFMFERPHSSVWDFYKAPQQSDTQADSAMDLDPPVVSPIPVPARGQTALLSRGERNSLTSSPAIVATQQHPYTSPLPLIGTTTANVLHAPRPGLPSPRTSPHEPGPLQHTGAVSPLELRSEFYSLPSREMVSTPDTAASSILTPPSTPPESARKLRALASTQTNSVSSSRETTNATVPRSVFDRLAKSHAEQRVEVSELRTRLAQVERDPQDHVNGAPVPSSMCSPLKRGRDVGVSEAEIESCFPGTALERACKRQRLARNVSIETGSQSQVSVEHVVPLTQLETQRRNYEMKIELINREKQGLKADNEVQRKKADQADEIKLERDQAITQRDVCQMRLSASESSRQELGSQLSEALRECAAIESREAKLDDAVTELSAKVEELELQVEKAGARSQELESERNFLRDELERSKEDSAHISAILRQEREANEKTSNTLAACEGTVSQLRDELAESQDSHSIIKDDHARQSEAASKATNDLRAARDQITRLDQVRVLLEGQRDAARAGQIKAEDIAAAAHSKATEAEFKCAAARATEETLRKQLQDTTVWRNYLNTKVQEETHRANSAEHRATVAEALVGEVRRSRDAAEARRSQEKVEADKNHRDMNATVSQVGEQLRFLQQELEREKTEKLEAHRERDTIKFLLDKHSTLCKISPSD